MINRSNYEADGQHLSILFWHLKARTLSEDSFFEQGVLNMAKQTSIFE